MNKIKIIAEIGINHNGSLLEALSLINIASNAGVDYVKFQKRTPRVCVPRHKWDDTRETPKGNMKYIEYKEMIEFGRKEYEVINDYCKFRGIKWSASVWDIDSFNFIDEYSSDDVPFIKIPSAQLTNIDLLKAVNKTDKEIILSIGMSTIKDVENALKVFGKRSLTILHCNSSYPASDNELDLSFIPVLQKKYPQHTIGYSGHEKDILPSIVAASIGAKVIERHITKDVNAWGTDHKSSLDPKALNNLVKEIRRVNTILGKPELNIYPMEIVMLDKLR